MGLLLKTHVLWSKYFGIPISIRKVSNAKILLLKATKNSLDKSQKVFAKRAAKVRAIEK